MFCCVFLCVQYLFCNHLDGEEGAGCIALFVCLFSWCFVSVVWHFLVMTRVCLQFVIVVFPDHTHLLFLAFFIALQNKF